jgi:hypothetical protein
LFHTKSTHFWERAYDRAAWVEVTEDNALL